MTPDQIQARVLYRDGLMLVLDKPSGLAVHAGPGGGDNLERYFGHLRYGFPKPPGLAHRLDRDTSGCLVLGRHPKALRRLGKLFQEGRVEKTYWAVCAGSPPAEEGRIELPLRKVTNRTGGWRIVTAKEGEPDAQSAVTDYKVMGRGKDPNGDNLTWIEFRPHTGRTHQIRVHGAAIGCPLLGDPQYGGPEGRLHLHSRAIVLPLYPKKDPVAVTAPVPAHMLGALTACGFDPDTDGRLTIPA